MRVVRSEKAGRPDATERENNKTIRGRVEVPLLRASPQRTRVGRQDLRRALYGDASKRVLERPPRVRSLFSSRARVLVARSRCVSPPSLFPHLSFPTSLAHFSLARHTSGLGLRGPSVCRRRGRAAPCPPPRPRRGRPPGPRAAPTRPSPTRPGRPRRRPRPACAASGRASGRTSPCRARARPPSRRRRVSPTGRPTSAAASRSRPTRPFRKRR